MVLPHLFSGEDDTPGNANIRDAADYLQGAQVNDPNAMRQPPAQQQQSQQQQPSPPPPQQQQQQQQVHASQQHAQQQQMQNLMMSQVVQPPQAMAYLRQQQGMQDQPQQPLMGAAMMPGMGFAPQEMMLRGYASSQQPPLLHPQAYGGGLTGENREEMLAAAMQQQQQQATYEMYSQNQQQQQQRRESNAQYSSSMAGMPPQMQQQPYGMMQQQPWMGSDPQGQQQPWNKQVAMGGGEMFQQDPQHLQQQGMMSAGYFGSMYDPQQQKRRRSSMSSTGSMSPLGRGGRRPSGMGGSGFDTHGQQQRYGMPSSVPFDESVEVPTSHVVSQPERKEKKRRAKTFPEKLMQAMMEHGSEDAVAWLPDGKSFVIVSPDLFVNDVLNHVFKAAKYASFVRKLHRWGFVRLTSGTGTDCFHHPLFNRNRREWASKISCAPHTKEGLKQQQRADKPPSLAGVERFIRAKAAAAAALAQQTANQKAAVAAAAASAKKEGPATHLDEKEELEKPSALMDPIKEIVKDMAATATSKDPPPQQQESEGDVGLGRATV